MAYCRQHPVFGDQWNGQAIDSSLSIATGRITEILFVGGEHWIFSTFQYPQLWWLAALFWKRMPPSFPEGCTYLPHSAYVSEGNRWQALEDYSSLTTKPYWCMDITDWNVSSAICQWRRETDWSTSTGFLRFLSQCLFNLQTECSCSLFFSVLLLHEYRYYAIALLHVILILHLEDYVQNWYFQNTFFFMHIWNMNGLLWVHS